MSFIYIALGQIYVLQSSFIILFLICYGHIQALAVEKKKRHLFSRKLLFTKSKERSKSENALTAEVSKGNLLWRFFLFLMHFITTVSQTNKKLDPCANMV